MRAFLVEWCYQSLSPARRNCSCVQRGLEYSDEHWGDFLCYHDQKSSRYVVRSRSLVWFKVFKEFDDIPGFMDGILLCPIWGMFVRFSLV